MEDFCTTTKNTCIYDALVTMVTEPALGETVHRWGGRSLVFHEAPPPFHPTPPQSKITARAKVIFTTIFDPDEPLTAITAAACDLAECDIIITGDDSRLAEKSRQRLLAKPHIHLTGWLEQDQYLALVASADVVVSLTRDPHSVMRSAFEAIYLERPTVLSNTDTLRACFSPSVFVDNSPVAVIQGVRDVLADYRSWTEQTHYRHDALVQRWASQRTALESVIIKALEAHPPSLTILSDNQDRL